MEVLPYPTTSSHHHTSERVGHRRKDKGTSLPLGDLNSTPGKEEERTAPRRDQDEISLEATISMCIAVASSAFRAAGALKRGVGGYYGVV